MTRNPIARSLRASFLQQRKVKPKKGRGAYTRKSKSHDDPDRRMI